MKYYEELIKFLKQAKTDNLKTKHFKSTYKGTQVKVSFGQGNSARIPWISFLLAPNTTSNGIYPVFLYFKELEKLILSYSISETNEPDQNWNLSNPVTINSYFIENELPKPPRYGDSYIFKIYDVNNLPDKRTIEEDLNEIINQYKQVNQKSANLENVDFRMADFIQSVNQAGLHFSDRILTQFCASLLTKPFVILTGLSGSGKTKLAQTFVQWISNDESQYAIIPVGADWTNREPLLGYPNALNQNEYVKPDNGALDLILRAIQNPDHPYFLILDEMNLSHVERYFADFLSAMESKEKIPLHAQSLNKNDVPLVLEIPSNFFIIGTVNIDETTNMFSPKVLDRANTIEFRISSAEMKDFLEDIKEVNTGLIRAKGSGMAKSFLMQAATTSFDDDQDEALNKTLIDFFKELKKTGAEFGYRCASEIHRLNNTLSVIDHTLTTNEKMDIAIMQKLLPKLHGSRRKLCPILITLGSFCIFGEVKIEKDVFEKVDFDFSSEDIIYPLTLEKLSRMYQGAIDNGFTSFAEA